MNTDLSNLTLHVDEEITLKVSALAEAQALFDLVEVNREHFRRFMWWVDKTTSVEGTKAFIQDAIQKAKVGTTLHCFIYYHGTLVGVVGFHFVDYIHKKTEIGYWLDKAHEGKGIVTRASKALIQYAFDVLGMHRIELRTAKENEKSQRIAERLGFTLEGCERDCCLLATGFHDLSVYSLLSTDK